MSRPGELRTFPSIGRSDYMEEDAHACISDMLAWSKTTGAATSVTRIDATSGAVTRM